jgi:hypothetical protein
MDTKTNLFELLQLRYEWEEIARTFKLNNKSGHIDNLKRFLQTGHKANRFRDGYDRAVEIAKVLVAEYPDERKEVAT